jgi:hypothetical protein
MGQLYSNIRQANEGLRQRRFDLETARNESAIIGNAASLQLSMSATTIERSSERSSLAPEPIPPVTFEH